MDLNISEPISKVTGKLESWLEAFISMIPNMIVAVILLVLFALLAKLARNLFKKIFSKASGDGALKDLFGKIIYFTVFGLGIFFCLGILKLDKAVTSLLAGVGVIGLALGFAFQDIAANFISGIILAFRKPYVVGDVIEVEGNMGKVARTNLRVTVIETFQGQEVYIPNKNVIQDKIINYSSTGRRRIDLPVGVSYSENLEDVESLVKETISSLEGVAKDKDVIFDYHEFGGSSINFNVRFWIDFPDQPGYLSMTNKAIKAIKKAFDANNITIPFPIRTLDFGIKGGQRLDEMNIKSLSESNEKDNNEEDGKSRIKVSENG